MVDMYGLGTAVMPRGTAATHLPEVEGLGAIRTEGDTTQDCPAGEGSPPQARSGPLPRPAVARQIHRAWQAERPRPAAGRAHAALGRFAENRQLRMRCATTRRSRKEPAPG